MNITTQRLTDILDEAERFTIHDAGRVIAAAEAARAFGPMPEPEPPKWWAEERTVEAERAAAERDFRVGQRAHVGVPDLPLPWSIDYHLDGATALHFRPMQLIYIVNPDDSPEDLLGTLRAIITTEASNAAANWRAQAADLIIRADQIERFTLIIPRTGDHPMTPTTGRTLALHFAATT